VLGHSFGADVVVDFANYLGQHGIPTELVIGFDPNGSRVFRLGAKNAINYRSARVDRYVKGEGFRGTIRNVDVSHYGANHFNIEQVKAVQELALKEVLAKAKVKSTRRRR
jgi:thioesterase domain-containing protein